MSDSFGGLFSDLTPTSLGCFRKGRGLIKGSWILKGPDRRGGQVGGLDFWFVTGSHSRDLFLLLLTFLHLPLRRSPSATPSPTGTQTGQEPHSSDDVTPSPPRGSVNRFSIDYVSLLTTPVPVRPGSTGIEHSWVPTVVTPVDPRS